MPADGPAVPPPRHSVQLQTSHLQMATAALEKVGIEKVGIEKVGVAVLCESCLIGWG